jgi:hypothetical protein
MLSLFVTDCASSSIMVSMVHEERANDEQLGRQDSSGVDICVYLLPRWRSQVVPDARQVSRRVPGGNWDQQISSILKVQGIEEDRIRGKFSTDQRWNLAVSICTKRWIRY